MKVIYKGDPVSCGGVLYEPGKEYDWPAGKPLLPGMAPVKKEWAKVKSEPALEKEESHGQ